jgi:TRAP-type C4-dicarboxylate transport system permease small subunit
VTSRIPELLARLDRFGRAAENVLLVTLLSGMILLSVGQIALREFFGSGFIWGDELLKLMVLWLAMIAAIAACRDNRHIRIDALSHLMTATAIRISRVVVDIFAAAVCAVIAWHAFRYLRLEVQYGDRVLIDTPAWLAHGIVSLAFTLTAWRFLVGALRRAAGLDGKDEPGTMP